MSVQINNTGKTTFTPEQQLELQKRLSSAKSKEEARAIFDAYKKEIGLVEKTVAVNNSKPVKDSNNVDNKKPIPGTVVEQNNVDDKNIISRVSTTSFSVDNLITQLKLDPAIKDEFLAALEKSGIKADKDGNISFSKDNKALLEKAISQYIATKQTTTVVFDETTDREFVNRLIKDGAIKQESDGSYSVLDNKKLQVYLTNEDQAPATQPTAPTEISLDATTETRTLKKENAVDVPTDLKNNRNSRKKLEKDYEAILQNWVEDPENQETIKYSLAQDKYNKQISKQMDKIGKEFRRPEEILQKYYNDYATDDEKKFIDNLLENAKKDEKGLLEAYNRAMDGDEQAKIKSFDNDTRRNIAAYLKITESDNFNPAILVERMAVSDVMDNRSPNQIEKDKKDFIKAEAERQAKKDEAIQNLANTRVHFSSDDRKKAEESETNLAIEHNDIGDRGRKLVNECPDEFCDRVDNPDEADPGIEPMKIKDPKTGEEKTVYFKFNEQKWKNYFLNASDSRHLDDESQENYIKEANMTLKEGRKGAARATLITRNGTRRSFEEIIGNDNGKVGNRDLNRFRDLAKTTGLSVDVNRTAGKRALHVLKDVGIGAALGFATGGLGSLASGAVNIAGQTASQMIGYSGVTADQSVTYSGTTSDRVIHDSTTFTYEVNGETYTKVVNKDITVPGQEYSGTIDVSGQEYSGQVEAKGQNYSGSGNNHLKTAGNAAVLGALGGLATGAMTAGGVHANGRNFDGVVNLTKEVEDTETKDTKLSLSIPKSKTITVRSGKITEGTDVPTRPAVKYRGPEAYTVLYSIDNTDIPAKYKKAVYKKLDEMWRQGTNAKFGDIPKNVPVYESFTINVDGKEITVNRKQNWQSIHIAEGDKGNSGGIYDANTQGKKEYNGRGTITKA